ncbi:MAG: FCD domain-containing protein [bacterium]
MSDIIRQRRNVAPDAATRVLAWLQELIRTRKLGVGDALPGELEIARRVGVGRSAVREALIALKVLGIIHSRRKGGIRLVRDPVLLELRRYFGDELADGRTYSDAMAFRAALEWGLVPLMLDRVTPRTIRKLREVIDSVGTSGAEWSDIGSAEIRFHTGLIAGCGNRLAMLCAYLYGPIFRLDRVRKPCAADVHLWRREHTPIVDALERTDAAKFLVAMRKHTHGYMRLRGQRRNRIALSEDGG